MKIKKPIVYYFILSIIFVLVFNLFYFQPLEVRALEGWQDIRCDEQIDQFSYENAECTIPVKFRDPEQVSFPDTWKPTVNDYVGGGTLLLPERLKIRTSLMWRIFTTDLMKNLDEKIHEANSLPIGLKLCAHGFEYKLSDVYYKVSININILVPDETADDQGYVSPTGNYYRKIFEDSGNTYMKFSNEGSILDWDTWFNIFETDKDADDSNIQSDPTTQELWQEFKIPRNAQQTDYVGNGDPLLFANFEVHALDDINCTGSDWNFFHDDIIGNGIIGSGPINLGERSENTIQAPGISLEIKDKNTGEFKPLNVGENQGEFAKEIKVKFTPLANQAITNYRLWWENESSTSELPEGIHHPTNPEYVLYKQSTPTVNQFTEENSKYTAIFNEDFELPNQVCFLLDFVPPEADQRASPSTRCVRYNDDGTVLTYSPGYDSPIGDPGGTFEDRSCNLIDGPIEYVVCLLAQFAINLMEVAIQGILMPAIIAS
ncbi:MAG: hypothetical protein ABH837_02600 [bacterium]